MEQRALDTVHVPGPLFGNDTSRPLDRNPITEQYHAISWQYISCHYGACSDHLANVSLTSELLGILLLGYKISNFKGE